MQRTRTLTLQTPIGSSSSLGMTLMLLAVGGSMALHPLAWLVTLWLDQTPWQQQQQQQRSSAAAIVWPALPWTIEDVAHLVQSMLEAVWHAWNVWIRSTLPALANGGVTLFVIVFLLWEAREKTPAAVVQRHTKES